MKNNKFGWNEYFEPTPKNVRKMADSLMIITGAITAITPIKWVVFVGIGAKVLSNFLSSK